MSPLIPKHVRRDLRGAGTASRAITVHVGGAPYPAVLDKGVLRFKENWCVRRVMDYVNAARPGDDKSWPPKGVDMNGLALAYLREKLPLREYAELHMLIGYSLSGFCDLSPFADLEVKTPSWTREGRTPWK